MVSIQIRLRIRFLKHKRFKSPTANIPKLVNYPSINNVFDNGNTEVDRRNRRRSGKNSIERKCQNNYEDEDKETLKKEYLRLKQQLIELQK